MVLPSYRCTGGSFVTIHLFSEDLSLCPRGHSFYRSARKPGCNDAFDGGSDGMDMNVFCFAERAHAEQFRERFGGEFIDPKDRPKWPGARR